MCSLIESSFRGALGSWHTRLNVAVRLCWAGSCAGKLLIGSSFGRQMNFRTESCVALRPCSGSWPPCRRSRTPLTGKPADLWATSLILVPSHLEQREIGALTCFTTPAISVAMEGTPTTDPAPLEPTALLEAIRYYSDLEVATKAFASIDQRGANIFGDTFSLPGITNWYDWSAR